MKKQAKTESGKLLSKCVRMFSELQCTYDLSEHSEQVEKLSESIKKHLNPNYKKRKSDDDDF